MRVELSAERGSASLYLQLANALQDVISLRRLQPGDVLPSETVLAAENQLSRATVIKAYDTLIERGLVTRRQGKGTFVNARPMERQLPDLTGFTEHVHGLGLAPGSRLLSFDQIAAESPDRPSSAFPPEVPLVAIERLRTVDDVPVGLHRTLVPADVAERSGLDERAVARDRFSLYSTLRAAGIHLASGEETLSAINANDEDAEMLGVEPGTALIEIVRDSYDADGRLVEVVRARYLGSQYRYHIQFAPSAPGGSSEETNRSPTRTGGGLDLAHDGLRQQ